MVMREMKKQNIRAKDKVEKKGREKRIQQKCGYA